MESHSILASKPNLGLPIYCHWVVVKKRAGYGRIKQGAWAAPVQPRTPPRLPGGVSTDRVREGHRAWGGDQLAPNLRLVGGEVTGGVLRISVLRLLVPAGLGSPGWGSACSQRLPPGGGVRLCKTAQGRGSGCALWPWRRDQVLSFV